MESSSSTKTDDKSEPFSDESSHKKVDQKRTHEKPLKVYGTLDDVLRAAVKEKPSAAKQ